ncbi:uncharacterized protein LOC114068513 [Empidonax traillii]|uniref:uncharacterized protein LOC114068513 n=1 Tax=Empidonax traillii TaxID=164674 RepID=UPI000FFD53F4|nr:uncharacterized protein LOC114068513 [Empidonax traillii]
MLQQQHTTFARIPQSQAGYHPAPCGSVLKTLIVCQDQTEKYPGFRPATMSAPAFQCEARSPSSSPECTPYHTSRDIRYIFLESCRNIPAFRALDAAGAGNVYQGSTSCHPTLRHYLSTDEDCYSSLPQYLPTFFTFSRHLEKEATDLRRSPGSKKRLPVFRQLCGEAVEELEELPGAKAPRENVKGWRVTQAAGCSTCSKA